MNVKNKMIDPTVPFKDAVIQYVQ